MNYELSCFGGTASRVLDFSWLYSKTGWTSLVTPKMFLVYRASSVGMISHAFGCSVTLITVAGGHPSDMAMPVAPSEREGRGDPEASYGS